VILQRWTRGPVGAATIRSMCGRYASFLPAEGIARIFGTVRVRSIFLRTPAADPTALGVRLMPRHWPPLTNASARGKSAAILGSPQHELTAFYLAVDCLWKTDTERAGQHTSPHTECPAALRAQHADTATAIK
jgi:hypothetical protein